MAPDSLSHAEARQQLESEHELPKGLFLLLFIGASDWDRKGLGHILDALPGLSQRVHLLVVGAGTKGQREKYEALSSQRDLEERIITRKSDLVYLFIFAAAIMEAYALLADELIHFLSPAMMFLVITVWSRKTTDLTVTWFGVLHFGVKWQAPRRPRAPRALRAFVSAQQVWRGAQGAVGDAGALAVAQQQPDHQPDGRGDRLRVRGAGGHLAAGDAHRAASGRWRAL